MAEQRKLSEAGKLLTTYAILGSMIHTEPVANPRVIKPQSSRQPRKHPRARVLRKYGKGE